MPQPFSSRILIVATDPELQEKFREILAQPAIPDSGASHQHETIPAEISGFAITFARTEVEGVAQVHASLPSGHPFDLAFVSRRLGHGTDGFQTIRKLWQVDASLHVVLCVAASDYLPGEITRELGPRDRLLILKMPFDALEARQMAVSVAQTSNLLRHFQAELSLLQTRLDERTRELESSRARDESHRQNLEAQLRLSQKMESVGQLAGGIAHDFNNLLTVIQGHASLALATESLSPKLSSALKEITQAAIRAADLTRQLLTFSRKQKLHPQPVDLNELVKNFSKILRRTLGEDISLEFAAGAGLPPVMADPGMIEQVLLNLAVNSRDAMPKGGKLTVATSHIVLTEADARRNPEAAAGSYVRLVFADTGCGIHPENLPRIFEPFFTTKELDRGTGLGLATVYGIIKQHQGWIEVESGVNRGTTFTFFLPCGAAAVSSGAGGETTEARIIGGTETILVVEDEVPLLQLIEHILQSHGYKVIGCTSGKAALELWQEHRRKIEMLLTDVVLPDGMTGPDLAEIVQISKPGLKVIFMSGYDTTKFSQTVALQPGVNFLQKPFHARTLAETVFDTLQKK